MARKATPAAEWNTEEAPPTGVKKIRNAGRQFGATVKTKVSEAAEKRAVRTEAVAQQTRTSTRRRAGWERSTEGKKRLGDVVDYATQQHNKLARERPELGLTPQKRLKLTHQQAYEHYGFGEHQRGPGVHDVQLPGMQDPDALPRPKRWEEHTEAERADISKRVKAKSGATPESMERSFGSQLDQGYLRARSAGAKEPYAQTFYLGGLGEPAEQMRKTRERQGVSLGLVAATNADTSPQMKFSFEHKEGHTSYPNAEQAEHAISEVRKGKAPGKINKKGLVGFARSGFDTNFAKAARRAHQVIRGGKSVSETFMGTGSGSGFGPKTAAYHNSWLTGHPQFLVSDVHTGGGGMVPHLGSEKPLMRDEAGNVKLRKGGKEARDKSEREKAIETAGFHAMADYSARQAMSKRGLGRVEQAQATQWGEEKIRRGEEATDPKVKAGFPSQAQAYPHIAHPKQFGEHPGQGSLF
jgi:hypothetical protein